MTEFLLGMCIAGLFLLLVEGICWIILLDEEDEN